MIKYIYICSAGHSGSTLLDLLLGSHSRIESLGEVSHLPKNVTLNTKCSCGAEVRDCNVWRSILEKLGTSLHADLLKSPYSLNTGYPKATTVVDHARQTPYYLAVRKLVHGMIYLELRYGIRFPAIFTRTFHESLDQRFMLYDTVREVQGVDIVVDSSKTYLEAIELYRKRPEEVRILLLSRDGRGVMYSNMKRNVSRKTGLSGWMNYYSRLIPLAQRHVKNGHILNVRYEDLVTDAESELVKICSFAGVEFERSMLNFAAHEHHITNGNNMRFSSSSELKLDMKWKSNLSGSDLDYFAKKAGPLNSKLGYQ